jgi:hypothetical protein
MPCDCDKDYERTLFAARDYTPRVTGDYVRRKYRPPEPAPFTPTLVYGIDAGPRVAHLANLEGALQGTACNCDVWEYKLEPITIEEMDERGLVLCSVCDDVEAERLRSLSRRAA